MVNNHQKRDLRTDIRSLMTRANGFDPDKIPYYVMWNISVWKTSNDDDDARLLLSLDDDEHFDSFEYDPTHPDARWSP
ncbi:hypothetical protein Tco_0134955 [Tanacetum coccineum]